MKDEYTVVDGDLACCGGCLVAIGIVLGILIAIFA